MKKIIAILVTLMMLVLTACAPQSGQANVVELLELGEQYLLDLDYEQALVQFLKVIEIEPRNVQAYLGAAHAYAGLGRVDEAIAILEQGLSETDDDALKEPYYKLLRTDDAYYTALDAESKQLLTELRLALEALDWETAYALQSSAACSALAAGLPPDEHGNRLSVIYYPDDTTRVSFFQTVGESSISSHMDIFRGTNGNGSMTVGVYDAHVHYRMDTVVYAGGKANGAFAGYYLGGEPPEFYTVTGTMLDGMPDGAFIRTSEQHEEMVITDPASHSFTKTAGWPAELVS